MQQAGEGADREARPREERLGGVDLRLPVELDQPLPALELAPPDHLALADANGFDVLGHLPDVVALLVAYDAASYSTVL